MKHERAQVRTKPPVSRTGNLFLLVSTQGYHVGALDLNDGDALKLLAIWAEYTLTICGTY